MGGSRRRSKHSVKKRAARKSSKVPPRCNPDHIQRRLKALSLEPTIVHDLTDALQQTDVSKLSEEGSSATVGTQKMKDNVCWGDYEPRGMDTDSDDDLFDVFPICEPFLDEKKEDPYKGSCKMDPKFLPLPDEELDSMPDMNWHPHGNGKSMVTAPAAKEEEEEEEEERAVPPEYLRLLELLEKDFPELSSYA